MKTFNSLDEIQRYYDYKSHSYIFGERGEDVCFYMYDRVELRFDLNTNANLHVTELIAQNILCADIFSTGDIRAHKINAENVFSKSIYSSSNITANTLKCWNIFSKSIEAWREIDVHFKVIADGHIKTRRLKSGFVYAWDVNAEKVDVGVIISRGTIKTEKLEYRNICGAYKNIDANSIKSGKNSKIFSLNGFYPKERRNENNHK